MPCDIDFVLSKRHDNGADFWATPDGRIGVGDPFSTIHSLVILHEMGLDSSHEAVQGGTRTIFSNWREDGRIRIAPKATLHPCYTAVAVRALCRFIDPDDGRIQRTLDHLLETRYDHGGWRCRKFSGGRGPETEYSNPGVTLWAMDAFRFLAPEDSRLLGAVESLLDHWTVRRPIGPCHFGIGTLFLQTEFPFLRYNLFYYVYVLSHYSSARKDPRFLEALKLLESKLDSEGEMIIERPNRRLAKLGICRKGEASAQATRRYHEILQNLGC